MKMETVIPANDVESSALTTFVRKNIEAATGITVHRAGHRNAVAKFVRSWTFELEADDDRDEAAGRLAEEIETATESDAGDGARRRYFVSAKRGAQEVDRIAIYAGEATADDNIAKTTTKLVGDLGDKHVALMDASLRILQGCAPFAAIATDDERARREEDRVVRLRAVELEAEDRREARDKKETQLFIDAGMTFAQENKPLLDGIGAMLKAKAAQIMDELGKK